MKAILMLVMLLFAGSLQAQTKSGLLPPYLINYEQQAAEFERQANQAKSALVDAQKQLVDCQALLVAIKETDLALDKKRLERIDSLAREANAKLDAEHELRVAAEQRAATAEATVNGLLGRLGLEAATNRFGGFGRRGALYGMIKYAITPKK